MLWQNHFRNDYSMTIMQQFVCTVHVHWNVLHTNAYRFISINPIWINKGQNKHAIQTVSFFDFKVNFFGEFFLFFSDTMTVGLSLWNNYSKIGLLWMALWHQADWRWIFFWQIRPLLSNLCRMFLTKINFPTVLLVCWGSHGYPYVA